MRLLSLLTAVLVALFLYALVLERDDLLALAATGEPTEVAEAETTLPERLVSVVVLRSSAQQVASAVLVRGVTEASRQVTVMSENTGRVISQPIRKGAMVSEGQLMCQLDPGTRESKVAEERARVPEARARVSEARARLVEARIADNAANRLNQGGFASETRVAAARAGVESALAGVEAAEARVEAARAGVAAAEKDLERLLINAPFAGLLESDTAEFGALLQPGVACATIIQLDPIKLVGFVSETEVDAIAPGAPAGARLLSGRELTGVVTFLSRSSDPLTRTFRVEIEVPNPDFAIRDGQTVEILIAAAGRRAHLLPGSAMTLSNEGTLGVRVVDADNVVDFVPVSIVRDTRDGIWLAGLPDEVSVIVEGQEYVARGVRVDVHYRETGQ